MKIYRHLSGSIVEVHEGSSQESVYKSSPSWREITNRKEEEKPESLLSNIDKQELIKISRDQQLETSVHDTKKELIDKIENKNKKNDIGNSLFFLFNDNLL
jgi:hypothetical protein